MRRPPLAAIVVAALACPALAHAGSVGLEGDARIGVFHFVAEPGEANDVRLTGANGMLRVEDRGAPLRAEFQCAQEAAGVARCPSPPRRTLTVVLGDRDDRFTVSGDPVGLFVRGGPGDDRLTGGPGRETLSGEAGRDVVLGRGGNDDLMTDGDDRIDGGRGRDHLGHSSRKGVVVDLRSPGSGRTAPRGIEDVSGGLGDDRLSGDGGANRLSGVGGADRIDGRGGDDDIDGFGTLRGGPGDDVLRSQGGTVGCGRGADRVEPGNGPMITTEGERRARAPRISASCETLVARGATLDLRGRERRRFTVRCDRTMPRCTGGLRAGGVTARFRMRGGQRRALRLRRGRRMALTVGDQRVAFVLG